MPDTPHSLVPRDLDADPYVPDPDIAELTTTPVAAEPSTLDLIRAELNAAVVVPTIELLVPKRPGWSVVYATDISNDQAKAADRAARGPKSRRNPEGEFDPIVYAQVLLNSKCVELRRGGRTMVDSRGRPFRFAHSELMDILEVATARLCVSAVYGGRVADADVLAAANRLSEASGWDSIAEEADPTGSRSDPSTLG